MPSLIFVPSGGVTGTLATADPTDAASFAGQITNIISGTLSTTEAPDTASLPGFINIAISGSLAAIETTDAAVFAATEYSSGILLATDAPDTAAFTGAVAISGTMAATERQDIASFYGLTYPAGATRPATVKRPPQIPAVPSDATSLKTTAVRHAQAINALLRGGLGCNLIVTLAPGTTTSTITDSRIGPYSHVILTPTTASAQAAQQAGMYVVTSQGICTINHANSAATDQTFSASLLG